MQKKVCRKVSRLFYLTVFPYKGNLSSKTKVFIVLIHKFITYKITDLDLSMQGIQYTESQTSIMRKQDDQ